MQMNSLLYDTQREALEATYEDWMVVSRPEETREGAITKTRYRPAGSCHCALSQQGGGKGLQTETFHQTEFHAKIFAPPDFCIMPGDSIQLLRFGRSNPDTPFVYEFEPAGSPAVYPTHQEIFVHFRQTT